MILRNLGFFATAESLVGNNLVLAIFKHVTNAECRQYLLRQAFEEAIHTHTFHYIVESLGLDEGEVFNMYHEIPAIAAKDEFEMELTADVLRPGLHDRHVRGAQTFLENLIGYYVIMEGIFFYTGFAMMLSLPSPEPDDRHRRAVPVHPARRDDPPQLRHRPDQRHQAENPGSLDGRFPGSRIIDRIREAVELEIAYAADCLPRGVLGLNADLFRDYVQFIADRRLERIGLPRQYGARNPFPWMSETIDLGKEKNFFETRVTEYRSGRVAGLGVAAPRLTKERRSGPGRPAFLSPGRRSRARAYPTAVDSNSLDRSVDWCSVAHEGCSSAASLPLWGRLCPLRRGTCTSRICRSP